MPTRLRSAFSLQRNQTIPTPAAMAPIKDSFLDLERHRQLLEDNVEKLRNALLHWQLWEAEYEALKEDVDALGPDASPEDVARVRRDFDGQLVTKKEVIEIFGGATLKKSEQIVNVVSRRVDYVAQNVRTLERQVEAAENKLAAAAIISNPDIRDEDGQPVTDIIEELDEDDNVVSYRLQTPGSVQPQIREALEKAGVKDLPDENQKPQSEEQASLGENSKAAPPVPAAQSSSCPQALGTSEQNEPEPEEPESRRESVSFAEDTKPGHESEDEESKAQRSRTAQRLVEIIQEAKEQEKPSSESPMIPEDESAEDADLRREMLQYSASDIAPIVAELELEEDYSDDDEDWDDDLDEDGEDAEDKYGRYKYSLIDDDYRERMKELEQRLGFKSSRTIAEEEAEENGVGDEGIGRITIIPASATTVAPSEPTASALSKGRDKAKSSKSVQFANALDIAPEGEQIPSPAPIKEPESRIDPISDIVERKAAPKSTTEERVKKPSRFKSARGDSQTQAGLKPKGPADAPSRFLEQDVRTAPTGPDGQTIADTLVERQDATGVREPDELDATLLHQEAASEYHRMRNRMIQKDGGFLKENQSVIVPLDEEEGGPKRMSRFKAARLSKQ